MDVLVVTSMYPPHSYGGYEASCQDVVARWRARGHRAVVLTTRTRVDGVVDGAEPDVRRLLPFYWQDHRLPQRSLRQCLALERESRAVLRAALDEVRPDVVSAWSMGAMSLGLLNEVADRGLPLVLVVCDDWLVYGERADLWRRRVSSSRLARRAGRALTGLPTDWPTGARSVRAVFVSEAVREAARARGRWVPQSTSVIGSGISERDFPVRPALPDRPWTWRLLLVGRIDPRKGIDVALRALARLPSGARLDVVGRGDATHRAELERLSRDLGVADRVTFGHRDRSELAAAYGAADCLLFPPVWTEPFGLVPLEAMACGTPVVTTGTGGQAALLTHEHDCLVVPPGDDAALAAAVERLAADPVLRRRIAEAGLRTAARHGVDRYAERLLAEHLAAVRAAGLAAGQDAGRDTG
ncbi:MAG TPA: glycosyltransferase family 4 protein [Mycobacteriales bacterium]|nr:glycosyltransferase family 4 protein [Mycobacteriales bacterium]